MKPVSLIDVDDVILDNTKVMKEYIDEATNGKGNDIKWFDYSFKQFSEEERAYIFEQFETERMYQYCETVPFAVNTINTLRQYFTIIFVTASSAKNSELRLGQLKKLFSWVTSNDIIHTRHKHLIKGDVLIDDSPQNILSSTCDLRILITQEWNKDIDVNKYSNIVRANSWKRLGKFIVTHLIRVGKFDYEEFMLIESLNK